MYVLVHVCMKQHLDMLDQKQMINSQMSNIVVEVQGLFLIYSECYER